MSADDKSKEVLDAVAKMSVLEVVDLIKNMEDKFGVSAAAVAAPVSAAAGAAPAAAEEKTEFSVILEDIGSNNKIGVIKIVREETNLGLKEAKDLVESSKPVIKEGMSKTDAEKLVAKLKVAGATGKME